MIAPLAARQFAIEEVGADEDGISRRNDADFKTFAEQGICSEGSEQNK